MKWKFVFNSTLNASYTMEQSRKMAEMSGYKFFMFNKEVLLVVNCEKTGITDADMI